jgi:hypothetical protein
MEIFLLYLWDEIDEFLGLAWHGAVAVAADLKSVTRTLQTASSVAVTWLRS